MAADHSGACYIFGAGEVFAFSKSIRREDYVIAADGGFAFLERQNISPDLVVGDFDSLGYRPNYENLVSFAAEKDDTDMMLAVRYGMEKGYREFHLYGGTGGRFDHTLANLQTLAFLSKQGMRGFLYGEHNTTTAITDTAITFGAEYKGYVSVFAQDTQVSGVSLIGLKYPLQDADLKNDFPLGVSNEFMQKESTVSVKKGTLLIVWENHV